MEKHLITSAIIVGILLLSGSFTETVIVAEPVAERELRLAAVRDHKEKILHERFMEKTRRQIVELKARQLEAAETLRSIQQ